MAVVIEEDALDRPVGGPEVMRDQLDQLLAMAGRDNVTVQVMPRSVAVHDGATIHQVGTETHLRAGAVTLRFTASEWAALQAGVQDDEFDLLAPV